MFEEITFDSWPIGLNYAVLHSIAYYTSKQVEASVTHKVLLCGTFSKMNVTNAAL